MECQIKLQCVLYGHRKKRDITDDDGRRHRVSQRPLQKYSADQCERRGQHNERTVGQRSESQNQSAASGAPLCTQTDTPDPGAPRFVDASKRKSGNAGTASHISAAQFWFVGRPGRLAFLRCRDQAEKCDLWNTFTSIGVYNRSIPFKSETVMNRSRGRNFALITRIC